ncbi:hypothetical protein PV326_013612 [Microctonus aethiopoides]|nr:hypothetical protein PV326_013612 [Microctonus aethiopoides]
MVLTGQTYTQILNNRGKVMFTKEGSPEEDDSYLGYSVISGDFIGNGDSGTAVGMPRGYGLHGKVVLLTSNMTNHQNITGEQMGGYFGYALACGDIDGDGLDDLIVGAPMYTIPDNSEMNIETGRIYIFYGKGPDKYREFVTRDGESNRGRFGLSLASLGDIDRDGYGDFAVGAPYAGAESRGAIYIYHGSRDGVLDKYSQAIHAEDLSTAVNTFGFSIAGGLDLDGNLYPDMVVGSYESSIAMFFRSRPVIKMVPADTYVEFGSTSKLISLDERDCTLSDTTRVACLPLKACFKYAGDGVSLTYDFNIQYVLDVKKTKSPRLFFLEHEGRNTLNHTITVERNQQFCRTVRVYVTPSIRDKLTSLDAEMRMSLLEERHPDNRARDPRIPLRPVLATTSSRKDTLSIRKNCGSDNICTPDLQLTVTPNVNKYLLGSGNRLELDVLVQNANEDAFEATYNLKLPPGVDYIKIERIDKAEIPVQCSAPKQLNNNTLKCDIGNPLPKGNLVHFRVLLQPVDVHDEKSSYEFEMNVNSTNSEPSHTIHDNVRHLSLEIWVETELLIEGESKPKDLYYNPDNYTDVNITTDVEYGPAFIHNYTIRNHGPSRIEEAEVFLIWPAATLAKDELIYLLEQPETFGPLICATANANPLSLKLEQRRRQYPNYLASGIVHEHSIGTGKTINVHTGYDFSNERPTSFDNSWKNSHSMSGVSVSTNTKESKLHPTLRGNDERVIIQTGSGGSNLDIGDSAIEGVIGTRNEETFLNTHKFPHNNDGNIVDDGSWNNGYKFYKENHTQTFNPETNSTVNRNSTHSGAATTSVNIKKMKYAQRYYDSQEQEKAKAADTRKRDEQLILLKKQNEMERKAPRQQNNDSQMTGYNSGEYIYGNERHYENGNKSYTWRDSMRSNHEDPIKTSDFDFHLHNTTSHIEVENFLNTVKHLAGLKLYQKQSKRYIEFLGRFGTSNDKKDYLEFKDGAIFPIQNRYGEQIYSSNNMMNRNQFTKIEAELIIGEDGRAYGRINEDCRFPLQGSWTHIEEKTYNIGSRTNEDLVSHKFNVESHNDNQEEYTDRQINSNRKIETYEKHIHGEQRTTVTKQEVKYGKSVNEDNEEDIYDYEDENYDDDHTARRKRADDMMTINQFKKYENQHRVRRNLNSLNANNEDDDIKRPSDLPEDLAGFELINENNKFDRNNKKMLPLCNAARCVSLRCTLGRLEKDEEVSISARYRIKGATLNNIAHDESMKISTQLVARVTKLPFIGKPAGDMVKSHEIFTNIEPTARSPPPDVIPLWVVVLSACAGTIILLLLIFLLHKCGFFKRNRPTDAPERQPLNRNGHFQHGDDHL